MTLTPRDLDLLETLTRRVRLLTLAGVRALGRPAGRGRGDRRRIQALVAAGWLETHVINAHPPLALRPVFVWQPGQDDPDAAALSEHCRRRWTFAAVPTTVIVATRRTAHVWGSTAHGLPAGEYRNHDLRLAQVYVHYRQTRPALARWWVGEHALPKAGYRIKDPDAFLIDGDGRVRRVIESAGRYDARQVEQFHEHCVDEQLPYELW